MMIKHIWSKLKVLILAFLLLMGMVIPELVFEKLHGENHWQVAVLTSLLAIGLVAFYLFLASKCDHLKLNWDLITWKSLGNLVLGYGLMWCCDQIGFYWLEFVGQTTTANETAVAETVQQLLPLLIILWAVVLGPITEELVIRGLMMRELFGCHRWLGLACSSLLFAALHGPTDLPSWFIYGSLGLIFGELYLKTGNLAYPMVVHLINNFIASIGLVG